MGKIRQQLARNKLSRGQRESDKARNSGESESDSVFESAYKKFSSAASLDPENAAIVHSWGVALYDQASRRKGKEAKNLYKAAGEKFAEALKLDPDNAKVMNDWGATLIGQARNKPDAKQSDTLYERAREKILAANALEAGLGAYNLACIHGLRGEAEECRKWLNQAREAGNLPGEEHLKADKDLDNVRDRSWFRGFMRALSEKAEADREVKAQAEAAKSKKFNLDSWWHRLKRP